MPPIPLTVGCLAFVLLAVRFRKRAETVLPKIPICVRRHRGWKRQHLHKREREARCGFHENNLPSPLLNSFFPRNSFKESLMKSASGIWEKDAQVFNT